MSFLVDTNILSELAKSKPSDPVVEWAREHQSDLYISTITLGELKYGIAVLRESKRKRALQDWLTRTNEIMEGRILSFNRAVAYVWADLRAKLKRDGQNLPVADGLIAATAKRHELTIVTRNTADFAATKLSVLNPFEE